MEVVNCQQHGLQQECFVCIHLLHGTSRGFHQVADGEDPRPDAWCDACQGLLEQYGDWDDIPTGHPEIVVVCATCYDLIRSKNLVGPQ